MSKPFLPFAWPQLFATALLFAAQAASAQQSVVPDTLDTIAQRVAACTVCHGKEGRAGSDGYYPRLAGKPAGYLYNQLVNFRDGKRTYPVMTAMLDNMSDAYLREIAQYFADQHPPYPPPQPTQATAAELERGRQLVHEGDKAKGIPACIACHGTKLTGTAPAIPGLIGLPRDYLLGQIGAWKIGTRHAAQPDCMAQIVQKMSSADISAATAWLAEQHVPADASPAPRLTAKLPLECGKLSP
ncbi:c-type cytochrome [Oxalicibacterium solurbis]|uniref:Cytochrome c n=1 Tax=Oxalicibacterium solurbis TaxID=69280 RepID=A0A8J3AUX7_9BURK|nr:c-type cytochrome [Oxalicibacterium solurbis]GGI53690.1 cytochrome c [Oxalicibacterium solurbis]